jgi:hypothetical protein
MTIYNFGKEYVPGRFESSPTRSARPQELPEARGQSSREITYASKATVPPLTPLRQRVQHHAKHTLQGHDSSEKREGKLEQNLKQSMQVYISSV